MLKIDNSLLEEVGLGGLPETEKNSFLKHMYETLEMRVGIRLADQMSNQQLDEFEQYFEAKDDAGAFKWLETNFPNYKEIVQEEFDKLKAEVAQSAPQILAASQAQPAAPASVQPPMQGPNTQASQPDAGFQGAAPQTAPAPAQPYAAPQQPSVPPAAPYAPQSPQAPHFDQSAAASPQYPPQQPPAGPQQS